MAEEADEATDEAHDVATVARWILGDDAGERQSAETPAVLDAQAAQAVLDAIRNAYPRLSEFIDIARPAVRAEAALRMAEEVAAPGVVIRKLQALRLETRSAFHDAYGDFALSDQRAWRPFAEALEAYARAADRLEVALAARRPPTSE